MPAPFMQLVIQDTAMRSPGFKTPSPLVGLSLENAESGLQTNFTATLHIYGDSRNNIHIGSFEMMLYEFAQMQGDSVLPVYLEMGWAEGSTILSSLKIQALFIQFKATVHTGYMEYTLKGTGNFTNVGNIRGIAIPAIRGNFQPSYVLEAVLDFIKARNVFDYDIDHDDEIVPINKPSQVTSLGEFVLGSGEQTGILQQSYSEGSKSAAYRLPGVLCSGDYRKAGYSNEQITEMMGPPVSQTQRSASAYTFSIVDPTFYERGIIRYKNNVNLANYVSEDALIWGGLYTNILSITATYDGVTQQLLGSGTRVQTGMAISLQGDKIVSTANRQNSYAATASSMFAAGNVINNLNAISTQFNTDIVVTIVGQPKIFQIAEAVRVLVYTGGTLNPITGVYRILKVSHKCTGTAYTTSLTLKRLDLITANNTASSIAGYTNPITVNGQKAATRKNTSLDLGEPFQDIMNLMRRGQL